MSTTLEPPVMPPTELALTVPEDVPGLVANASQFELAAQQYVIDSEASFQVADQIQASLKVEAKAINEKRMEFTRPIDAIKKKWMDFFAPAVDGRTKAAHLYQVKMSEYRRREHAKAMEAQQRAERELQERKAEELAAAQRLEQKASNLKTDSAKEKALADAQAHRQAAEMMPTTVALSAAEPQTVASNVAQIWEPESVTHMGQFLCWLAEHPEWHGVIQFKTAEINRMAKQFRDVVPVPGIKFHSKDSFRTKSR